MKGELFALGAAVCWATAVILFKRSGERVPPLSLNLYKTTLSFVLLVGTLVAIGHPLFPDRPFGHYALLLASGVVGITLSDTLFFYGLNLLGASLNSIVECLYSPSIILLAFLVFGEGLTLGDGAGLVLILSALFTVTARPVGSVNRREVMLGVACGAGAMLTLAASVMMFKPIAEDASAFWICAVRTIGALVILWAVPVFSRAKRAHILDCFVPARVWWWLVPGSILGTYVSLVFWTLGFKYTDASRAAILNQSNTIFVLILATVFLREPLTPRKLVAIALGLAGVAVVTLA